MVQVKSVTKPPDGCSVIPFHHMAVKNGWGFDIFPLSKEINSSAYYSRKGRNYTVLFKFNFY